MGLTKMKKDVKQKATEAKKDEWAAFTAETEKSSIVIIFMYLQPLFCCSLAVKVELKLPAHVKHEPFDFMDRLFSGLRVVGMGCEDVPSGHGKVKGYFVQSDLEPRYPTNQSKIRHFLCF